MSRTFKSVALFLSVIIALLAISSASVVFAEEDDDLIQYSGTRNLSIEVGQSAQLEIPAGMESPFSYYTSDPDVLSVNPLGSILGLKPGQATIKVTNGTHYQLYDYTVKEKVTQPEPTTAPPTTMKTLTVLGTLKLSIEKGKTVTLSHAGIAGDITYRSGNPDIATVSNRGVVTGVKIGTTYVQVFNNTHVQNYEVTVTEVVKETTTVEETTTGVPETVTINNVVEEESTTYPDIDSSATVETQPDNSELKTRIIIITVALIVIIIVAAVLIYKYVASRNDDYPVDFYPDDDFINDPGAEDIVEDEEFSEDSYDESGYEDDYESPEEQASGSPAQKAEAPAKDSFDAPLADDLPDDTDDGTFLL